MEKLPNCSENTIFIYQSPPPGDLTQNKKISEKSTYKTTLSYWSSITVSNTRRSEDRQTDRKLSIENTVKTNVHEKFQHFLGFSEK
jgi:hypothetical protein